MAKSYRAYRIAAGPDKHTPFHDQRAIDVWCEYLKTQFYDAYVDLGDLIDHESISRFVIDSPKKLADGHLLEEWAIASRVIKQIIDAVRTKNKHCLYYQIEGNHEARTRRFEDRFPMLRGMFDLSKHLDLEERKGTWVPCDSEGVVLRFEWHRQGIVPVVRAPVDRMPQLYHGVTFTHGLRYNMHNAKATADLFPWPGKIIYGHTHTCQMFTTEKWGLDKVAAYTIGWMGMPYPEYAIARPNRWQQGFAEIFMDPRSPGLSDVKQFEIHNGRLISADGEVYHP